MYSNVVSVWTRVVEYREGRVRRAHNALMPGNLLSHFSRDDRQVAEVRAWVVGAARQADERKNRHGQRSREYPVHEG